MFQSHPQDTPSTQNVQQQVTNDAKSLYRDRAEERRRGVINNDEATNDGLYIQDVDEDEDQLRIKGLDIQAIQEKRRQDIEAEEAAKQALISTYYNADNLTFSSTFARTVFRAGVEKPTYAAPPVSLIAPLTSTDYIHDPDTTSLLSSTSDMAHRIALLHTRFAPGGTVFTVETNPYQHWTSTYSSAPLAVHSQSHAAYQPLRVTRAAQGRQGDAKAGAAAGAGAASSRSRTYNQHVRLAVPNVVAARVATALANREKSKAIPVSEKAIPGLSQNIPKQEAAKSFMEDTDDIFGDSGEAYIPAHRQANGAAVTPAGAGATAASAMDDDDIFAGGDEWKPVGLGGSNGVAKEKDGKKDDKAKTTGKDGRPVYSWLEKEEEAYADLFPSYYAGESVDIKTLRAQLDDDKSAPAAKGKKRMVDDDDDDDDGGRRGFEKDLQAISKRMNLNVSMDERSSKRARILGKR